MLQHEVRTGDPRSAATARAAITALVAATYLIMVVVNYGADALPLNGIRTGQVADSNPNLFARRASPLPSGP